jgi:hypothetical protein
VRKSKFVSFFFWEKSKWLQFEIKQKRPSQLYFETASIKKGCKPNYYLIYTLCCGETGLWTFLSKILMNQHFNSVQFFKCNDLVTENCLFVSLIDFRLSKLYHYITKLHFPTQSSKSQSHFYVFTYSIIPSENRFCPTSWEMRALLLFTYQYEHLFQETRKQLLGIGKADNAKYLINQ